MTHFNHLFVVLACLALLLFGADGKKSKVEELTPSDFKSKVGLYFFFWAWMNCDDEYTRQDVWRQNRKARQNPLIVFPSLTF